MTRLLSQLMRLRRRLFGATPGDARGTCAVAAFVCARRGRFLHVIPIYPSETPGTKLACYAAFFDLLEEAIGP